eukprot:8603936-Ditylum_brightwellii.AAC.1
MAAYLLLQLLRLRWWVESGACDCFGFLATVGSKIVVWVVLVDLVVEVVTAVLVAAAMASLALAKCPFVATRHYIPF